MRSLRFMQVFNGLGLAAALLLGGCSSGGGNEGLEPFDLGVPDVAVASCSDGIIYIGLSDSNVYAIGP